MLDVPESTVKNRLARAREKLRRELGEDGDENNERRRGKKV